MVTQDVLADEGTAIQIDCIISGKPFPTITWYRDNYNTIIRETDRINITSVNNSDTNTVTSSLQFGSANRSDTGSYNCVAEQYLVSQSMSDVITSDEIAVVVSCKDKAERERERERDE